MYLLFGPPLVLGILLLLIFLLLRTDSGLQYVENLANRMLAVVPEQGVVLSGLHGRFPFDLRLDEVRLADADGEWLAINGIVLRWSARDLLAARLRVVELSAKRLAWYRLPRMEGKEEPAPRESFQVPALSEIFFQAAVDRLTVEEIFLAEAVAGVGTLLRLDADLDAGRRGLKANLRLEMHEDPTTLFFLQAGFVPKTDTLTLGVDFNDPGGVFASLLGLPAATPLHVQFSGDGPPASWTGICKGQAGGFFTLASDVVLDWQEYPKLQWAGEFVVNASLLPEPADSYLPETQFRIAIALPEPEMIRLEDMTLENAAIKARLSAELNLEQGRSHGELHLDILDTAPLNRQLGLDLGPDIRLRTEFSGPFAAPDIHINLALQDLTAAPVRIAALGLDAAITFKQDHDGQIVTAQGTLRTQGLHLPEALPPEDLSTDFELEFIPSRNQLDLKSLVLQGEGLDIMADAQFSFESTRLSATINLPATAFQPWLAPYNLEYSGEVFLRAAAHGTLQPLAVEIDLHAGLEALAGLPDPLADVLGESVVLDAMVELVGTAQDTDFSGSNLIRVKDVHLQSKELNLHGWADFSPETNYLATSVRLALPDLAQAFLGQELDLTGAMLLETQAEGILDRDFSLQATLSSDDLHLRGQNVQPLQVVLNAEYLTTAPQGSVTFSTSLLDMALAGQSDFALEGGALDFSNLLLTFPAGDIKGQGQIDLDSGILTAGMSGRVADMTPLAGAVGLDLDGSLDFQVSALAGPEGEQNADLLVELADFSSDFGGLRHLSLKAQTRNMYTEPELDATLNLQALNAGELQVEALTARISGTMDDLTLGIVSQGWALHPFDLDMQASYATQQAATGAASNHVVHVHSFNGTWADQALALATPLHVLYAESDLTVSPLLLELGQATIRGQAYLGKEVADLQLAVVDLPLSLFTEEARGALTAEANLSGLVSAMRADITLRGEGIASSRFQHGQELAVDLQVDAAMDAGDLTVDVSVHRAGNPRPLLQAWGRSPARFALEPFGLDLPEEGPVDAFVRGTLDLNWLGDILLPEIQLLTGVMDLDVQLTGALSAPVLSGSITIDDASYQHLQQGVLLGDIAADITLDKEFLHLQSLTATDGNAGTLAGQGRVRLDSGDGFPFSLSLLSSGMNLIDNVQVTAVLAELQLELSGSTTAQEVQGHLTFASVEIRLKDMGGPSVVDLNVVEVNDPTKITARAEPAETAAASPPSFLLDVEARFPARVFVRGRGLDSEWGGRLNLTGSARAPTVRGDVTLHRGRLDLLGRRFTLSQESVIQFFGTQPPMPYVDIGATQTGREGDTFTLNARGVVPDIEFHLSSDPPLPEDEILAQMLFGRNLTNITPIQAAKLALATRELAGQGSGIDFFGTARDIFQLDDLDIVSSERDNNMSLRTGKHLTERVYLRLDSDLSTGGEQVSADVELTPRINLESKAGSKGSGLGLFWKYDY
jgi:autotransporter translocation and assembly factor TamB